MNQVERVAMSQCAAEEGETPCAEPCELCLRNARAAIAAMWTPFDPEDEATWPEWDTEIFIKRDGKFNKATFKKIWCNWGFTFASDFDPAFSFQIPTHYSEVTEIER